jgi:hypothetical protein
MLIFFTAPFTQKHLARDKVLFEGYPLLNTHRKYLRDFADEQLIKVDGVGGAVLLVRGEAHRRGLIFPPFGMLGF